MNDDDRPYDGHLTDMLGMLAMVPLLALLSILLFAL